MKVDELVKNLYMLVYDERVGLKASASECYDKFKDSKDFLVGVGNEK